MDEVDAPPPEMEPAVEPDEPEAHAEEPPPEEPPASSPDAEAAIEAPSPNTGRAAMDPPPPEALAAMDPPPPDAGLEMTAPREERKEDAAAEDDDDDGADADESQVFLLHPRFEALSIRSGFSKVELEGLDGPRLLRTSFLLFSIQVAWFSGQQKRAKFPTSKAPISAVFHSFRLIFGRAIISRKSLEAWMRFPERARAEHSR